MKKIRLTEKDLHNIIKESVKRVLKESYSSNDVKNIHDYDDNFGVSYKHSFDGTGDSDYAPFYTHITKSDDEEDSVRDYLDNLGQYDEFQQKGLDSGRYWGSLETYDKRFGHDVSPSIKDKKKQIQNDWSRLPNTEYPFDDNYGKMTYDDESLNKYDKGIGSKKTGDLRLKSFDDDIMGDRVRSYNGTRKSVKDFNKKIK